MLPKALLRPTHCGESGCLPTPRRNRAEVCCDSCYQDLPRCRAGLTPDSLSTTLVPPSLSQVSEISEQRLLPQHQRPRVRFCTRLHSLAAQHKSNSERVGEILLSGSAKSSFTPLRRAYTRGKQQRVAGEIEALVKCLFSKNRKKKLGCCCRFPEMTKSFLVLFS